MKLKKPIAALKKGETRIGYNPPAKKEPGKTTHIKPHILSSKVYQGQHVKGSQHKFRTPGQIALWILAAKHKKDKDAIAELTKIATTKIGKKTFSVIIPVSPNSSKLSIPETIGRALSRAGNGTFSNCLSKDNKKCSMDLKGKNVLIVDDVIDSGATMRKAIKACQEAGAAKITFYAIAKA